MPQPTCPVCTRESLTKHCPTNPACDWEGCLTCSAVVVRNDPRHIHGRVPAHACTACLAKVTPDA